MIRCNYFTELNLSNWQFGPCTEGYRTKWVWCTQIGQETCLLRCCSIISFIGVKKHVKMIKAWFKICIFYLIQGAMWSVHDGSRRTVIAIAHRYMNCFDNPPISFCYYFLKCFQFTLSLHHHYSSCQQRFNHHFFCWLSTIEVAGDGWCNVIEVHFLFLSS